jgi:hypothetical protein
LTGDPNDPVICVGDPDTNIICKKQSEFWDCTKMPNGDVKCAHTEPVVPNGKTTWTCTVEGDKIVCKSSDKGVAPGGGSDWTCHVDENGTTCEKTAPVPPNPTGSGGYNCGYTDSEFHWACTGTPPPGTPPPGTAPDGGGSVTPPPMPPGNQGYICYDAKNPDPSLPTPPEGWWAQVIAKKVIFKGQEAVYVRVTFSKAFVDNVYGQWAFGYHKNDPTDTKLGGHSFHDLVESDKAEIFFNNAKGDLNFHIAVDYISPSSTHPSGYGCLGVEGGEGQVMMGSASDVLAAQSSLSVNFNAYNYVLTQDSPKTDKTYKPDPAYPKWIWAVWYEVWVKWSAFKGGVGKVYITGIHASPSKIGQNKMEVVPVPCK